MWDKAGGSTEAIKLAVRANQGHDCIRSLDTDFFRRDARAYKADFDEWAEEEKYCKLIVHTIIALVRSLKV